MSDWSSLRDCRLFTSDFVRAWWETIPAGSGGAAMPSILALLLVSMLIGLSLVRDAGWRNESLRQSLQAAVAQQDHATVALLSRRLLREKPEDLGLRYQMIVAQAEQGGAQRERAVREMETLALQQQMPQAAQWILRERFARFDWNRATPERRRRFRLLATVAIKANGPKDRRLVAAYADTLMAGEQWKQALPLLERLAKDDPARALQAAALHQASGHESLAAVFAADGLKHLRTKISEEPENASLYVHCAQLHLLLGHYEQAFAALNQGFTITDDAPLRSAAAETLVIWAQSLPRQQELYEATRVQLLQRAVNMDPQNSRVIQAIVPLVLQSTSGNSGRTSNRHIAKLRQALLSDVSPGLHDFVKGTAAMMDGDAEAASAYLSQAMENMPETPIIMNNLAVALSQRDSPELEKALALVDAALTQSPDEPYMHETRGQILLKLRRYREAIAALERAMPAKELAPSIHRGLAAAYRASGHPEMAEEHRAMAAAVSLSSQSGFGR